MAKICPVCGETMICETDSSIRVPGDEQYVDWENAGYWVCPACGHDED